jgi:ubiquinone/menaquinone biosynthesis C-methylase UbiE
MVEIGCGIGRMTCAFTREFGTVIASDLDAGFLERCHETVARFGEADRLKKLHVADGQSLEIEPNVADLAFSYITFQHCDPDDALALSSEAVRVVMPGGKIALNYRSRSAYDVVLLPLGSIVRQLFRLPRVGEWLSRQRFLTRIGWQANRLEPDEVIDPLAPLLRDIEVWRNPRSSTSGRRATSREFEGINKHHYWVVATTR